MDLILDKNFLQSFVAHNSFNKELYHDFTRFLQRLQPGFTLVTNFSSLQELEEQVPDNPLLEGLVERNPRIVLLTDLPQKLEELEFYETGCSLKLFLVEASPGNCDLWERRFGYCFFCALNLSAKWPAYSPDREGLSCPISSSMEFDENMRFDSWDKLRKYQHPLNAILIADNYILADKSNQKIDKNLKELLKRLVPDRKSEFPVELTIIAEEDSGKPGRFKGIYEELNHYLSTQFSKARFELSIVTYDRSLLYKLKNKEFSPHDRFVITNNFCFNTGQGFNLFNQHGKLNPTNSTLQIQFNFNRDAVKRVQYLLSNYYDYAGVAKNAGKVYGSGTNRLMSRCNQAYPVA